MPRGNPLELIVLAPARTKNSRSHEVPLSTQALAILARQPQRTGEFGDLLKLLPLALKLGQDQLQ
jgi:hypothetical protein